MTLPEVMIAVALFSFGVTGTLHLLTQLEAANLKVSETYQQDLWIQNQLTALKSEYGNLLSSGFRRQTRHHPEKDIDIIWVPQTDRFTAWRIERGSRQFTGSHASYSWVSDPDQISARECRSVNSDMVD